MSNEPPFDSRPPIAADECPSDPVGEGLHWFGDDDICRYCGCLDMLRSDEWSGRDWRSECARRSSQRIRER